MNIAITRQKIQDWITQQWVILLGQKVDLQKEKWIFGPFGELNGIGLKFVRQLAEKEQLTIENQENSQGLLRSIHQLGLSETEERKLSPSVVDFYQNTADYKLKLTVKWNPFFKAAGLLIRVFFSQRLEQLNIPIWTNEIAEDITNEIIYLRDLNTKEVKRIIWFRSFKRSGQVVYLGVYETCTLPSGTTCIKAIFPLPNGNATVILSPKVGEHGELILDSSGNRYGDSGFYFLLKDSNGQVWAKYLSSFKDQLVVKSGGDKVTAIQTLTLWNIKVLTFEYLIKKR